MGGLGMTAYFIASYRITDLAGYEPYVPAVIPTLMAAGCEILVADYVSEPIEGVPGAVTVVLKFASKAAAKQWYMSPEYQAIKHLRLDHSEGTAVLVDQWTPPE
jgi:uncharacterized protein (DUF1330 family)